MLEALRMAVARRRPSRGLVHHTDRGSQYASAEYRAALVVKLFEKFFAESDEAEA